MKKIGSVVLVLVMALATLTGCGTTEKQEAIMKYVNEDMKAASTDYTAFSTAMSETETLQDDEEVKSKITDVTLPAAEKVLAEISKIKSSDSEVQALHDKFVAAMTKIRDAYSARLDALDAGDADAYSAATQDITDGNSEIAAYNTAYKKLCDDNDVTLENK